MEIRRVGAVLGSAIVGAACVLMVSTSAGAASSAAGGRTTIPGSHSSAVAKAPVVSTVPGATSIDFEVALRLADPGGASAWALAVSDPASPQYRRYLTASQWEHRFSPTAGSVSRVRAWLTSQGFTVTGVTADRLTIDAQGTVGQIERAFDTTLNNYRVARKSVRLAATDLSVPTQLASVIDGVTGLDGNLATPDLTTGSGPSTIPFPPGFRNAQPCSSYYGQKTDTTDPAFGGGYAASLPYTICGYVPAQFQSAYGLSALYAAGDTGAGVTVAIVDAYASPSLLADAQHYYQLNDPKQPLASSQFSESVAHHFNLTGLCGASGWFGEQTLDVEAVHATAPGAHILYVGAKNCAGGLFDSVQQVVDNHSADIITDSWGDTGGDLLDSSSVRQAFDNVLIMAAGTGIGVQFSSGDAGDNYAGLGLTTPDYPASSPWVTAVGGTALQIGAQGQRLGELGWSTSKSTLCTKVLVGATPGCTTATEGTWQPPAPGAYLYGGGGGTSYNYPEPSYQQGVVPTALAARNQAVTGIANRVEPDVSMDADIQTGMLIGETQEFGGRAHYGQYRIGGTSVASPLFAGVMALADQMAGSPIGFANPTLYSVARRAVTGAFFDVVPGGRQANVRVDFLNSINARQGESETVRTFTYEEPETYCDGTGNCGTQNVALSTAPGFDSMTGIGTPGPALDAALAAAGRKS
jgi:subtilase family serine protease